MSRAQRVQLRLLLVVAVLLAGCGTSSVAGGATSPTATSPTATSPTATSPTATSPTATSPGATGSTAGIQNVDGLAIDTTSDRGSMAAIVSGITSIDPTGCWILTTPGNGATPIVWPLGTRWTDAQHTAVVVASGVVIRRGQSITAGGGTIDKAPRSQVSIARDVRCLGEDPVSYVVVNPDVTLSS